ncbi:hypothetical protein WICPIJ_006511 [Wickerhamomyces pijperi]|uniref:Cytochrome b5 heme-binding domain-containing protein n=1 Tax=Wickerhamomyces pijperi TaxID=599730 RepID=A0A9P8TKY3_WICPI|nr:hypothetical protein WICPIJ_006511 [Wickerhamomyces pijperi]
MSDIKTDTSSSSHSSAKNENQVKQRKTNASSSSSKDEFTPHTADATPLSNSYDSNSSSNSNLTILDCLRMLLGILMLLSFTSYVSTGTFLSFGYNGKFIKPSFIKHIITRPNLSLTIEELSQFNGMDPSKPIYISINRTIWDVSEGKFNYGQSGAYNMFAGQEISRALATNCMNHLSYDLRDLEPQEIRRLKGWQEFFDHKYWIVGHLQKEELKGFPPSRSECVGKFGQFGS